MLHGLYVLLWQSNVIHACDVNTCNTTQPDVDTLGVSAGQMLRCKFVSHCILTHTMLRYQLQMHCSVDTLFIVLLLLLINSLNIQQAQTFRCASPAHDMHTICC